MLENEKDNQKDELLPTTTEGYKLGDKKTIQQYEKLDHKDEALQRWKASLGIGKGNTLAVAPGDERTAIICQLILVVEGRPDYVIDAEGPGALESLRNRPITIKEGAEYRMKVKFRVQREVISGLRYLQLVKRKSVKVDRSEEMMGSFAPNTDQQPMYEKTFLPEEAPSGILYRGHYDVLSRFMDDDGKKHLEFSWSFEIKKTWE